MTLARSPVLLERVYVVVLGDVAVDVKSPAALAGPAVRGPRLVAEQPGRLGAQLLLLGFGQVEVEFFHHLVESHLYWFRRITPAPSGSSQACGDDNDLEDLLGP